MWLIATDDPVAWCVSLSVTPLSCAKTAERVETVLDPMHTVLDGRSDCLSQEGTEDFTNVQQCSLKFSVGFVFGREMGEEAA